MSWGFKHTSSCCERPQNFNWIVHKHSGAVAPFIIHPKTKTSLERSKLCAHWPLFSRYSRIENNYSRYVFCLKKKLSLKFHQDQITSPDHHLILLNILLLLGHVSTECHFEPCTLKVSNVNVMRPTCLVASDSCCSILSTTFLKGGLLKGSASQQDLIIWYLHSSIQTHKHFYLSKLSTSLFVFVCILF